jgi:hypothetical protein
MEAEVVCGGAVLASGTNVSEELPKKTVGNTVPTIYCNREVGRRLDTEKVGAQTTQWGDARDVKIFSSHGSLWIRVKIPQS